MTNNNDERDEITDDKNGEYMKKIREEIARIPFEQLEKIKNVADNVAKMRENEILYNTTRLAFLSMSKDEYYDIMKKIGITAEEIEKMIIKNKLSLREELILLSNLVHVLLCRLVLKNIINVDLIKTINKIIKSKNSNPTEAYIQ